MRRHFAPVLLAAAVALAGTVPAAAKEQAAPAVEAATAPRLVLAISVDQLSADLFARYRRYFTAGLARLQEGAVFPSGFQSHAATETCPGHATLLTGVHPARSGIIANMWFDPAIARADKRIYCSEDERDPASTSNKPVVSAWHLKVPTLGDRLKAADRGSRNVAVSAKDRAVMMMGGHAIDQAWWWRGGAFVTQAGRKLAPEAEAANARAAAEIKAGAPQFAVPAWCAGRERAIPVAGRTVGTGHFPMNAGSESGFRSSPRIDAAVGDLAIAFADGMKLGQGKATDMLSVSFSATDYVGHTFGTEGVEMCIQLDALDKTIGRLLDHLDQRGIDYAVVLSADHGGFDLPERLVQQGLPEAARVGAGLSPRELGEAVKAGTGIAAPSRDLVYSDGPFGDFYVSRALSPADKARAIAALAEITRAHPQVAAVFTAQELAAAPIPSGSPQDWTLLQRARASFNAEHSGDVVVLLDRAVVPTDPAKGAVATHGSPWDYDRRVPILFWRKGLAGFEQPAPVETVDIAPTLAALIGLKVPAGEFDGRCLDINGGEGDTCSTAP